MYYHHHMIFICFLFLVSTVCAQNRCADAPDEGRREICRQIEKWDKDSRTVPPNLRPLSTVESTHPSGSNFPSPSLPPRMYDCMDFACFCSFLNGSMVDKWCKLPNGQMMGKPLRKEYRQMTDQERSNYHAATWKMKRDGSYSELSLIHADYQISAGAHSGPAFLPWHREFIKRMEFALRKVDPTVSLPYWDSTLDNNIPNPLDSILWGEELMGYPSIDNSLLSGSFARWTIDDNSRYVSRRLGEQAALMNEDHIKSFMGFNNINDVLASTAARTGCPKTASWNALEYTHGNPHVYVGGDMLISTNSTNDPIFFLHHCFIDLVWENWRQSKQNATERESQYPEDNLACNSMSHFGISIMQPFEPLTNIDGLSNKYAELADFQARPSCTVWNPDCASRFLFCDLSHGEARCASRIRLGGDCTGFNKGEFPCYEGICINNRCAHTEPSTTTGPTTTGFQSSTTLRTTLPHTTPPSVTPTTSHTTTSSTTSPTRPSTVSTVRPTTTTTRRTNPPTPTRPTTTEKPSEELCLNEHHCCEGWANYGECEKNPLYMNVYCSASCKSCKPLFDVTKEECVDRANNCDQNYASTGCTTPWMYENCRKKCNLCHMTRHHQCIFPLDDNSTTTTTTTRTSMSTKTTTTTTSRPTTPNKVTCFNYHYCCEAWAQKSYCTSKTHMTYMKSSCAPSCNSCQNSIRDSFWNGPDCKDIHPSCKYWASKNECELSSEFMHENCKLSCGKCQLLDLEHRLKVCGHHASTNKQSDPLVLFSLDTFDISPQDIPRDKLMPNILEKIAKPFAGNELKS